MSIVNLLKWDANSLREHGAFYQNEIASTFFLSKIDDRDVQQLDIAIDADRFLFADELYSFQKPLQMTMIPNDTGRLRTAIRDISNSNKWDNPDIKLFGQFLDQMVSDIGGGFLHAYVCFSIGDYPLLSAMVEIKPKEKPVEESKAVDTVDILAEIQKRHANCPEIIFETNFDGHYIVFVNDSEEEHRAALGENLKHFRDDIGALLEIIKGLQSR